MLQMKPGSIALAMLAILPHTEAAAAQPAGKREQTLPEVRVQAGPDEDTYQAQGTRTGVRSETLLRDLPQSVTVINRAVLEAQGAASLQDALRYVPGITMSAGEGGAIGNNINLRGFSARTDLYLDGMRDRGQYYRDTFFLDAVEVLKGPSSMLFGRGSTGGVINQVSKAPGLLPRGEATFTVGTGDYYRTTADVNRPLGETSAMRVAVMAQDIHSTRDVMDARDYGIAPSLRFGIGTPTQVTLSALVQHNRDMPDYGVPFIDGKPASVRLKNFYGLTDDRTTQDVQIYTADIEHKVDPTLTLRNQTRYGKYDIDAMPSAFSVNAAPAGTPLSQRTVTIARKNRVIDDGSIYNQTDAVKKFATGGVKHTLLAGVELGWDSYRNRGYTWTGLPTDVSLVAPVYQATPPGAAQALNATRTETRANTLGIYLNDTAELGRHWKLVGGLRRDRFSAEQETITNASGAVSRLEQTVHATSVRSGLIFQPTETQSYYISYGTSFNPSAETLAVSTTTPNLASVAPEKNRSYELGAKWDLHGGDLSLASALFRIEKTNARSTDPVSGFVNLDGDVRVDGFEMSAAGRITPKWQVLAAYTYLDGEIVKSLGLQNGLPTQGNAPANTPKNSASLWTAYRLTPEWEVGGGALRVGSRYVTNANNTVVDGYTRLDAMVAYHQPKYDVRLNLLNLTDEDYFESIIGSDGGRAAPGRGRTALLTVSYKF